MGVKFWWMKKNVKEWACIKVLILSIEADICGHDRHRVLIAWKMIELQVTHRMTRFRCGIHVGRPVAGLGILCDRLSWLYMYPVHAGSRHTIWAVPAAVGASS